MHFKLRISLLLTTYTACFTIDQATKKIHRYVKSQIIIPTKSDASNERFIVQFIPKKCNKMYHAEPQEFLESLQLVVFPIHRTSYKIYTPIFA